jgi:tetratricopeptide (TPR) repeat protein
MEMKKRLLSIGILIIIVMMAGCSSADSYYKDGKKSFEKGDLDKAIESFASAIEQNPNRADYQIDYSLALIAQEKYEEALIQLDQAYSEKDMLIVRENNKKVFRARGIAYFLMQQDEMAIEEFNKALEIKELDSLDMDILYYMADAMYGVGRYEEAVAAYTTIIENKKKPAQAYAKRASCYKQLKEDNKSLEDYNKAISLDSKNYEYHFGKYYLLADYGDEKGALEAISEALEITAATTEDNYNIAKFHFLQGNYKDARTELEEAYGNGFLEAYYYIGESYRLEKDYTKAIYYYDLYLKSGELVTAKVYNQMAICKLKQNNAVEALEFIEKGLALKEAPTIQGLQRNEIVAYENLGKFEEADIRLAKYQVNYPGDKEAIREALFIDSRLITAAD